MAREFRIEGVEEAVAKVGAFQFRTIRGVRDATKRAVIDLDHENKMQMSEMIYDQPESPTYKRTGRLRAGFRWLFYQGGFAAEYFTKVKYAIWVHDGTSKMPPRKFLQNAFDRIRLPYVAAISAAVRKAIRG